MIRAVLVALLVLGACGDDTDADSDGGPGDDGAVANADSGSLPQVSGFCSGAISLATTRSDGPVVYACNSSGGFDVGWSGMVTQLTSVAYVDLAGDAKPDLLLGRAAARSVVYRRESASFQSIADLDLVVNTRSVAAGDFDDDGDLDFALANDGGDNVYRNDGATFVLMWTSPAFEDTRAVAWANLDGDADLDLAAGHEDGVRVYRFETGAFSQLWASPQLAVSAVAWADYDGDDDPDLLVATSSGADVLFRNDGATFTQVFSTSEVGESASAVWVDHDGDSDMDFLITSMNGARLYRNDAGTFSLVDAGLPTSPCHAAAWMDVDADGDPDLVVQTPFDAHFFKNEGGQLSFSGVLTTRASSLAWGAW